MTIKKSDIENAIARYLPSNLNYIRNSFGDMDEETLFKRLMTMVALSFISDRNAIFYLTYLSVQRLSSVLDDILSDLDALRGDNLLRSAFERPQTRITDFTSIQDARNDLASLYQHMSNNDSYSDLLSKSFSDNIDSFIDSSLSDKTLTRNTSAVDSDLRSVLSSLQTQWADLIEKRTQFFSIVETFSAIDLKRVAGESIIANAVGGISAEVIALAGATTQGQYERAESSLVTLSAIKAVIELVNSYPTPFGTKVLGTASEGRLRETDLQIIGEGTISPPNYVARGDTGRLYYDYILSNSSGYTDAVAFVYPSEAFPRIDFENTEPFTFTNTNFTVHIKVSKDSISEDFTIVVPLSGSYVASILRTALNDALTAGGHANVLFAIANQKLSLTSGTLGGARATITIGNQTTAEFLSVVGGIYGMTARGTVTIDKFKDAHINGSAKKFTDYIAHSSNVPIDDCFLQFAHSSRRYSIKKVYDSYLEVSPSLYSGMSGLSWVATKSLPGTLLYEKNSYFKPPTVGNPLGESYTNIWDEGSNGIVQTTALMIPDGGTLAGIRQIAGGSEVEGTDFPGNVTPLGAIIPRVIVGGECRNFYSSGTTGQAWPKVASPETSSEDSAHGRRGFTRAHLTCDSKDQGDINANTFKGVSRLTGVHGRGPNGRGVRAYTQGAIYQDLAVVEFDYQDGTAATPRYNSLWTGTLASNTYGSQWQPGDYLLLQSQVSSSATTMLPTDWWWWDVSFRTSPLDSSNDLFVQDASVSTDDAGLTHYVLLPDHRGLTANIFSDEWVSDTYDDVDPDGSNGGNNHFTGLGPTDVIDSILFTYIPAYCFYVSPANLPQGINPVDLSQFSIASGDYLLMYPPTQGFVGTKAYNYSPEDGNVLVWEIAANGIDGDYDHLYLNSKPSITGQPAVGGAPGNPSYGFQYDNVYKSKFDDVPFMWADLGDIADEIAALAPVTGSGMKSNTSSMIDGYITSSFQIMKRATFNTTIEVGSSTYDVSNDYAYRFCGVKQSFLDLGVATGHILKIIDANNDYSMATPTTATSYEGKEYKIFLVESNTSVFAADVTDGSHFKYFLACDDWAIYREDGEYLFEDDNATFITDGVEAGQSLKITSGTFSGQSIEIDIVESETVLKLKTAFAGHNTGVAYHVGLPIPATQIYSNSSNTHIQDVYFQSRGIAPGDIFRLDLGSGSLQGPSSVSSAEMVLWLKPSGFGGNMQTWSDSSGRGNHGSQSIVSLRPVEVPNGLGSYTTARFDGSDDHYSISGGGSLDMLPSDGFSAIYVSKVTGFQTFGTVGRILSKGDSSPQYLVGTITHANTGAGTVAGMTLRTTTGNSDSDDSVATSVWKIYYGESKGSTNGRWRVDGVASASPVTTTVGSSNFESLTVGASNSSTGAFAGEIAEIILFKGQMSTADVQLIEGYLSHKYGLNGNLPSSHPYFSSPPAFGGWETTVASVVSQRLLSLSDSLPSTGFSETNFHVRPAVVNDTSSPYHGMEVSNIFRKANFTFHGDTSPSTASSTPVSPEFRSWPVINRELGTSANVSIGSELSGLYTEDGESRGLVLKVHGNSSTLSSEISGVGTPYIHPIVIRDTNAGTTRSDWTVDSATSDGKGGYYDNRKKEYLTLDTFLPISSGVWSPGGVDGTKSMPHGFWFEVELTDSSVGGWMIFKESQRKQVYTNPSNSGLDLSDYSVGDTLIINPGESTETRHTIDEIESNDFAIVSPPVDAIGSEWTDITGAIYSSMGRRSLSFSILPQDRPNPGMQLLCKGTLQSILNVREVSNYKSTPASKIVLEFESPLPVSLGTSRFFVLQGSNQEVSSRLYDIDPRDLNGAQVSGFEDPAITLEGSSLRIDGRDYVIESVIDNSTLRLSEGLPLIENTKYSIQTGDLGLTDKLDFETSYDLEGTAAPTSSILGGQTLTVQVGDLITIWTEGSVVTIETLSNSLDQIGFTPFIPSSRKGLFYCIVRGGAVDHGRFFILDYLNNQITLDEDLTDLSLLVAEVIHKHGGSSTAIHSSSSNSPALSHATVASVSGETVIDMQPDITIDSGQATFEASGVIAGDLVKLYYNQSSTEVITWVDKVSSTQVVVSPAVTATTSTELVTSWSVERNDVSYSLQETNRLHSIVRRLKDLVDNYTVSESESVRNIIEVLSEKGMDRAIDLLLDGKIEDFFALSSGNASYSGLIKNLIQGAASQLFENVED